jgi:DNA-binding MarR family transcriptional regulator
METLTDQQHHLLAALKAAGRATAAELVSVVTPQSMVRTILDQSEAQGFAARQVDEGQGREVWQLTVRGADALEADR